MNGSADFPVGISAADESQHLSFAWREPFDLMRAGGAGSIPVEALQYSLGDGMMNEHFTRNHLCYRAQQLVLADVFQHECPGTQLRTTQQLRIVVKGGQYNHGNGQIVFPHIFQHLDPALDRHLNVQQNDIDGLALQEWHHVFTVRELVDEYGSRAQFEQTADSLS